MPDKDPSHKDNQAPCSLLFFTIFEHMVSMRNNIDELIDSGIQQAYETIQEVKFQIKKTCFLKKS